MLLSSPDFLRLRGASRAVLGVVTVLLGLSAASPADARPPAPYREWGRETMEKIDEAFWNSRQRLYSEESRLDGGDPRPGRQPAFMWSCGVQLSALVAAAKLDRSGYETRLRAYADALDNYWITHDGVGGYDVLPNPQGADRYYDDNAWMVLAFAEAYEVLRDSRQLDRAVKSMEFVLSGEDEKLGGGLYWREKEKTSKNTCTNAPAITGLLKLHQLTGKPEYVKIAERLYKWTNENLQDPEDGLYWDHIAMDGKLDRRKFSYNSALMIRANCLIYEITKNRRFLEEARRIANAAVEKWIKPDGGVADGGRFAHLLMGAFLELAKLDRDPKWLEIVDNSLRYVHANVRDPNGHYPNRWDRKQEEPLDKSALLDEASVARAYWEAAATFR